MNHFICPLVSSLPQSLSRLFFTSIFHSKPQWWIRAQPHPSQSHFPFPFPGLSSSRLRAPDGPVCLSVLWVVYGHYTETCLPILDTEEAQVIVAQEEGPIKAANNSRTISRGTILIPLILLTKYLASWKVTTWFDQFSIAILETHLIFESHMTIKGYSRTSRLVADHYSHQSCGASLW